MNKVRHILRISAMPHDSRGATKLDNRESKRAKSGVWNTKEDCCHERRCGVNRIFCRNFIFFFFFVLSLAILIANLSNMDVNKGYLKCFCETLGFISSVSRTPIRFFFSTTVAISSKRLSPLSYPACLSLAAILVVTNHTNGRFDDKENTFSTA